MPLENQKLHHRPPEPRSSSSPETPNRQLFSIKRWRAAIRRVFKEPNESDRRNNSFLAKNGKLTVNRPKTEEIPNLESLTVLSIFQPSKKEDKAEDGIYSYYKSLNYYLNNLLNNREAPSSFIVFMQDHPQELTPKRISIKNNRVFLDKEEIFVSQDQKGWEFPPSLLSKIIGYKIIDNVATNIGVRPMYDNNKLRKIIAEITEGNPDITMLHYRGHNEYGSGANIPEDLLDPAIVFLGGCKSARFTKKAQVHHFRSGIIALKHKTGWHINHHRARNIMKALKTLKDSTKKPITWEDLSNYLRTIPINSEERFGEKSMILPGDELI